MSRSRRWTLVLLVAVVALIVALWPRAGAGDGTADAAGRPVPGSAAPAPARLQSARDAAGLPACPAPSGEPASAQSPLAGVTLRCLADGAQVPLAAALAGHPALLNVWAYWCAPCAAELPQLQAYAERAGSAVTVLTVHFDPDQVAGLSRLTDLGIRLPGLQDGERRLDAAVSAPSALPYSVLVRPDGTVARVVVRPFHDVDDIAQTVREALGVST